jgi:hypothetical protein
LGAALRVTCAAGLFGTDVVAAGFASVGLLPAATSADTGELASAKQATITI